jgi:hypothetical protein
MLSRMLPMLMVICLGVVCLFVFFAVLNLFSPAEVLWLCGLVAVLAVAVTVHSLWIRRRLGIHGNREMFRSVNVLRERRGF